MNYKSLANDIIKHVGGLENVGTLTHCSTRLRFILKDESKVDVSKLESLDGVLKVITGNHTQIVIGNNVVEVYDECMKLLRDLPETAETKEKLTLKNAGKKVIEFMMAIFYPLIPAMAGAGMLKSILVILSMVGVISQDTDFYVILSYISDALFYFMPVLVAYTAAEKLKCDKIIAVTIAGFLIFPNLTALITEGTTLFGFSVQNIAYGTQIFPAILCTLFCAFVQKYAEKVIPKALKIIFVPLITFLISVPVGLLILGPLGYVIGNYLAAFLVWFQSQFGFLAVAILSAALPLMVATGMHKSFNPIAINNFTTLGYEPFYTIATLAHNVAECGAVLAVGLKSKDQKVKSIALSGSLSASLGITEPALYGVTLTNKTVLYSVMAGAGLGGAFLGFMQVKQWVLGVTPSVFTFTCFAEEGNANNLLYAVIGLVITLVASFVFSFLLYKDNTEQTQTHAQSAEKLYAPTKGESIDLSQLKDEMFSNKVLGDGVAVRPSEGKLYAPADGEVVMLFDTKHAIGLKLKNGAEILMHIGIDTVTMEGEGFHAHVKTGDQVKKGDLLIDFDIAKIESRGLDPVIAVIVSNGNDYTVKEPKTGTVNNASMLFTVEAN